MKRKETTFPTLRCIVGNDASLLINLQLYQPFPTLGTPITVIEHCTCRNKTGQTISLLILGREASRQMTMENKQGSYGVNGSLFRSIRVQKGVHN